MTDVATLTKLIKRLDISTTSNEVDMLQTMFSQMKIATSEQDVDDLINKIDALKIEGDEVTLKLNDNTIIKFKIFKNCGIDYKYDKFHPKWQLAF